MDPPFGMCSLLFLANLLVVLQIFAQMSLRELLCSHISFNYQLFLYYFLHVFIAEIQALPFENSPFILWVILRTKGFQRSVSFIHQEGVSWNSDKYNIAVTDKDC